MLKAVNLVMLGILVALSAHGVTRASGSGCAVSSNLVLTAYHVVKDADTIHVSFAEEKCSAEIVAYDIKLDWAILKVASRLNNVVHAGRADIAGLGDKIYLLGYPTHNILGNNVKYSEGSISSLTGAKEDSRYFQISAPIQPGNSGGPLFDKNGSLIGVVVATLDPKVFAKLTNGALPQNVNFALRLDAVKSSLIDWYPCEHQGTSVAQNELATCMITVVSHVPSLLAETSRVSTTNDVESQHSDANAAKPKSKFEFADEGAPINECITETILPNLSALKEFDPSACRRSSGEVGKVDSLSEYEWQRSAMDKLAESTLNAWDKICAPMDDSRVCREDILKNWVETRNRLADYYTRRINGGKMPVLPDTLWGWSLGVVNTEDKSLLRRLTRRLFGYKHIQGGSIVGSDWLEHLLFREMKLPRGRKFMGEDTAVVVESCGSHKTISIELYVGTSEDLGDAGRCALLQAVKTFEKKLNVKFRTGYYGENQCSPELSFVDPLYFDHGILHFSEAKVGGVEVPLAKKWVYYYHDDKRCLTICNRYHFCEEDGEDRLKSGIAISFIYSDWTDRKEREYSEWAEKASSIDSSQRKINDEDVNAL